MTVPLFVRITAAALMRKGPLIDVPDWRVGELELIRSESSPNGSVYTTLAAYRLRQ